MDLSAGRQIGLPTLSLIVLGSLVAAGSIIHAMGQPLFFKCGHVKLFYGGLDDPEVSQHFIDWSTFSHVGHGIAVYVFMRAFTAARAPTWLSVAIIADILFVLPRDNLGFFAALPSAMFADEGISRRAHALLEPMPVRRRLREIGLGKGT